MCARARLAPNDVDDLAPHLDVLVGRLGVPDHDGHPRVFHHIHCLLTLELGVDQHVIVVGVHPHHVGGGVAGRSERGERSEVLARERDRGLQDRSRAGLQIRFVGIRVGSPAVDITMPQLGETVTEGTVLRWCKQVGERIAVDEALLEVSTDKVDAEVPSPVAGEIVEILVAEGDTVPIGARLAVITESDGEVAAPAPVTPPAPTASPAPAPTAAPEPVAAPPAPAPPPPSAPAAPTAIEPGVVPFSNIRKRTAENLTQSLAHVGAHARRHRGRLPRRRPGAACGRAHLPAVRLRAVVDALAEFPTLNAVGRRRRARRPRLRPPRHRRRRRLRGAGRARRPRRQGKTLAELAAAAADLAQRAHAQAAHAPTTSPAARSPSPTSGATARW